MRDWLYDLRNSQGLTLKQMGEKLGISESYYLQVEQGKRQQNMDIVLITRIAAATGKGEKEIVDMEMDYRRLREEATTAKDP